MPTFKSIAYQILKEADKPLHSREITKIAKKRGLKSTGKTPEKTMEAIISVDIKKYKEKSRFVRIAKSTFTINKNWKPSFEKSYKISKLSSRQKGDIAENRIIELILLYGSNLACYKPTSDDEGIDLIIKDKITEHTFFIQVKSIWRTQGPVVTSIKKHSIVDRKKLGIVICVFDVEEGEISEYLWFIPAMDLARKAPLNKKYQRYIFVSGRKQRETNNWNQYLIDKRDLAETILEQMKKR
ncbi:MAG: hypothetical protein D6734_11680 [Candidatus Schekmanbacteria bacterium]|nr:MAG: hypothetical protein D6734_11680 [Candidatus Schekmanbacteria bacterium]